MSTAKVEFLPELDTKGVREHRALALGAPRNVRLLGRRSGAARTIVAPVLEGRVARRGAASGDAAAVTHRQPAAFRRSQGQIAAEAARALERARRDL